MKDNQPLISVITVCFNAAEYIEPTILSIRKQTFQNYEHLIIDGGSSDNTVEIVRKLDNPAIRLISEKDGGIFDAMNKGLQLAVGKYITFLNAGDYYYDENILMLITEEIRKGFKLISGNFIKYSANNGKMKHVLSDIISMAKLKIRFDVCHQTIFVRNDNLPLYDLSYSIKSDYKWIIDIVNSLDDEKFIKKINKPLVYYDDAGFSASNIVKNYFELITLHYTEFGIWQVIKNTYDYLYRFLRDIKDTLV